MDANMSIVAPGPIASPPTGLATGEDESEGGFAAALTRSLAAAELVPGGAASASVTPPFPGAPPSPPAVAPPTVAFPTAPASGTANAGGAIPGAPIAGTAAEAPAQGMTTPVPVMQPDPVRMPAPPMPASAEPAPPPAMLAEAPPVAAESETQEPIAEEWPDPAVPMTDAIALTLLAPPAIPVPAQPPRASSPAGAPVAAASEPADEELVLLAAGPMPPPVPASMPAPSQSPIVTSDSTPMTARPTPGGMAPLAPSVAPETEAAAKAQPSEVLAPPKPAHAEAHGAAAPEGPTPTPPGLAAAPILPPELAGLQPLPRAGSIEAAAPTSAAPPASPARQVSSVAVALSFAPGGSNGFRLSLEPAELGRVEIHVQRDGDSHSVRVTAERPETLALLQRDRHELDRGLAEAGLRVDSSGIDFSLDMPSGGGSFGQEPGADPRGDPRGQAGRAALLPVPEREAPLPRILRSLLDLNI